MNSFKIKFTRFLFPLIILFSVLTAFATTNESSEDECKRLLARQELHRKKQEIERLMYQLITPNSRNFPWTPGESLEEARAEKEIDRLIGFDIFQLETQFDAKAGKFKDKPTEIGLAKWGSPQYTGWSSRYKNLLLLYAYLGIKAGDRIVDIGSGYGRPGFAIGYIYPGVNYTGYEIVTERVQSAQQLVLLNQLENIRFVEQDVSRSDFDIESAQFYYMYDPVNDPTMKRVIAKIRAANRDKAFKIVLQLGGRGEYYQILKREFGEPTVIPFEVVAGRDFVIFSNKND
jgi:hypothetical protein